MFGPLAVNVWQLLDTSCMTLAHFRPPTHRADPCLPACRNSLETYAYNMKNTVSDKLKDKLSEDDAKTVGDAVSDVLEWMEEHSDAEASDFEDKLKEVQDLCDPIIAKVYQAGGGDSADEEDHDEL